MLFAARIIHTLWIILSVQLVTIGLLWINEYTLPLAVLISGFIGGVSESVYQRFIEYPYHQDQENYIEEAD